MFFAIISWLEFTQLVEFWDNIQSCTEQENKPENFWERQTKTFILKIF